MPLMTFALLLLIGSTGNLESLFFPLTYLHLFFLVLSAHSVTAVVTTLGLMLFHLSLNPQMAIHDWSNVLTIPILLVLFLFTKRQHEELVKARVGQERANQAKELLKLHDKEQTRKLKQLSQIKKEEEADLVTLESFLESFLKPKLEHMTELSKNSESHLVIKAQVELLRKRVDELLTQVKPN